MDIAWPCLSPDSADPHRVALDHQIDEIRRELHHRRRVYPGRILKNRLSQYDADYQIGIFDHILTELELRAAIRALDQDRSPSQMTAIAKTQALFDEGDVQWPWAKVIYALRIEIEQRRRFYPVWVREMKMDPATARQRLERIEAVHFTWWRWARHFMPATMHSRRDAIYAGGQAFDAYCTALRCHQALFVADCPRGSYVATEREPSLFASVG